MLGIVLAVLALLSVTYSVISGDTNGISNGALKGSEEAVKLCITLSGSMALWGGLLKIVEKCGVTDKVTQAVSKPLKKLFGSCHDDKTMAAISLNFTANLLGLANASTPLGIEAMKMISREKGSRSRSSALLLLMNTASVQLIPITICTMRAAHGAKDPWDCAAATVAVSFLALMFGAVLVNILYGREDA